MSLQTSYDTKLSNATYDALKAFQLNTINSDTSDLSNSKLRDIEASANAFFTSIANNFNMVGYNQDILTDYVPALVYTMYDGYYIYSPYNNTLDTKNSNQVINESNQQELKSDADILNKNNEEATYKHGERLSGLKPYIYYSCRYKPDDNNDFVITYSLDNYITIQGIIKGEWKYDQGFLLDLDNVEESGNGVKYRGREISSELPREQIKKGESYPYIKLNGVKYYKNNDGSWFSILNGKKYPQETLKDSISPAVQYYKEANEFTNRVMNEYELVDLNSNSAVDEKGNPISLGSGKYNIFERKDGQSIEDPDSNFNQQRLEVIRYSIEKNLSIAIANYNNYSGVTADFQMPKLKEDEWDKVVNNISIISFLQGLNIGGKIYNGYSIITNNKNQEVVNEDSIYIVTNDNQYHRANDMDLNNDNVSTGVLNIDFERKSIVDENTGETQYFFPNEAIGCYSSIVTQTGVNATDNLYRYMEEKGGKLAQVYFTALGRERYGMYRTNVNPETLKAKFK